MSNRFKLSPRVCHAYDLKQHVFIFEVNLNALLPLVPDVRYADALPKFPSVSRDITLIVNRETESQAILQHVNALDNELVESLNLFDIYEGDPIPKNKKSVSFRITYRSSKETLEDETVSQLHKSITEKLLESFDATLP